MNIINRIKTSIRCMQKIYKTNHVHKLDPTLFYFIHIFLSQLWLKLIICWHIINFSPLDIISIVHILTVVTNNYTRLTLLNSVMSNYQLQSIISSTCHEKLSLKCLHTVAYGNEMSSQTITFMSRLCLQKLTCYTHNYFNLMTATTVFWINTSSYLSVAELCFNVRKENFNLYC